LTGNPQITFWKMVYRRYTNFAMEAVDQTFNGSGPNLVATISRNGDLIHKCYLEFNSVTAASISALIDSVELEIGGQQIDKQTGKWMDTWNELSVSHNIDTFNSMAFADGTDKRVYVPLQFFFCQNPGLALPLIALQYHEVRVKVNFIKGMGPKCNLWVDYIYLDTDERRRMAQSSHELLITQLQYQEESVINSSIKPRLNFNHPCKELIWVTDEIPTPTAKAKLVLNGHDRFAERNAKYFQTVQPYQHHTRIPGLDKHIHVYSFCLKPEEAQPSGSCNFSRIDNAQLVLDGLSYNPAPSQPDKKVQVYATNWNVLRIMSGMGGLAYSN
jgi:hypothetical protein